VEAQFKILWADHGDDISRQYAGTGALKSGFTRTGKRTIGGLIDDGIKSMARYYLNNFQVRGVGLKRGVCISEWWVCFEDEQIECKLYGQEIGSGYDDMKFHKI
jgi:hypothetical protein